MKKLTKILLDSKTQKLFTIIEDDSTAILLYEGKTVMAAGQEDFHSGKEEAYFNKTKVKKSWSSALELYGRIKEQYKLQDTKLVEYSVEEELFPVLEKQDLYATDDCFC